MKVLALPRIKTLPPLAADPLCLALVAEGKKDGVHI